MVKHNKKYLVLDLGTTNVKGFVFDSANKIIAKEQVGINKNIMSGGRVQQDPMQMARASIEVLRKAFKKSGVKPNELSSFGLTTQRETTILWDAKTGRPVYPAIVWEDSRTKNYCEALKKYEHVVSSKTGLTINPYFSASKVHWILKNIPQAKQLLAKGNLKFGTPDAWLLWNLTSNHVHISDYTNVSRTLLFNIQTLKWDKQLLNIFQIPETILPQAKPSKYKFGMLKKSVLGFELPIMAVCGDQQASLFAAGSSLGTTKVTYGTGTFAMQIIGNKFKTTENLFTTLAAGSAKKIYAVEAKINIGAKQVAPLLNKPLKLKKIITKIVKGGAKIIKLLPIKPKQIIIDGGITQYKNLDVLQSKFCGLPVKKQNPYDGTALGVAKLLSS
jgi:glycerol kinase